MITHIGDWPADGCCPACNIAWSIPIVIFGIAAMAAQEWGWGIPFLIGGLLLGFLGIWYLRKKCKDMEIIRQREQEALERADYPTERP
jgi:hypothetical protein